MNKMYLKANLLDYLSWRGDLKFTNDPINKVDLLFFSQLALINFDGVIEDLSDEYKPKKIKDAYYVYSHIEENKNKKLGLIIPDTILKSFKLASRQERYKNVLVSDNMNIINLEKEEQASALTFEVMPNVFVIAFSGTDDTIIGWKENFNMMFKFPIEAQISACDYVNKVMAKHKNGKFYITGHSKGGNLAMYSCLTANEEFDERIISCVSFDGPGLNVKNESFFDMERFKKITSVLPQSSVVGVLFKKNEHTLYVKSINDGAYQHDGFSWMIKGKDFIYEKELTKEALAIKDGVEKVVSEMSEYEQIKFSDNLYKILCAGGAKDLITLNERKKASFDAYIKMPKEEKKYLKVPLQKLTKDKYVKKVVFDTLKGSFNAYIQEQESKRKKVYNTDLKSFVVRKD